MKFTLTLLLFILGLTISFAQKTQEELDSLTQIAYQNDNYQAAIKWTELSIGLAEKAEDIKLKLTKMDQLAKLYMTMGAYQDAVACFQELLPLQEKIYSQESEQYIVTLSYLGLIYDGFGEYEQAKAMHEQARDVFVKAFGKDSIGYAQIIGNLAGAYLEMEQMEEAEKHYLEAIRYIKKRMDIAKADEKSEIMVSLATAYNNLAAVYRRSERFEEAETNYLKASNIWKKELGEKNPRYITNINNLGALYSSWGRDDLAEEYYLKSLQAYKEVVGERHPQYFKSLGNLASLYVKMGDLQQAKFYAEQSMLANAADLDSTVFKDLSALVDAEVLHEPSFMDAFKIYSHTLSQEKDPMSLKKAYQCLDVIKSRIQNVQKSFIQDEDKFRRLDGLSNVAHTAIDMAVRIGEEEYLNKAFEFAEQNKSVLLASALQSDKAKSLVNLPDSLVQKERQLQQQLSESKKSLLLAKSEREKADRRMRLNKLNLEIVEFQKVLEQKFPEYHQLKYNDPTVALGDIQKLLNKETLLLEYFVRDTVVYIFAVDQEGLNIYSQILNQKQLNKSISQLRNSLTAYDQMKSSSRGGYTNFIEEGWQLYQWLLEPILKDKKGIKQLLIIPDAQLGYIPFEVLLTEKVEGEGSYADLPYLLKDYKLSYNYAASLMKENKKKQSTVNSKILGIAASYGEGTSQGVTRSPHLRNLRKVLSPLPAAEKEVLALAQAFEGSFLSGNDGTEAFFKANAKDYGIIHLAMHGLLNTQQPILSSLAFTENGDSLEDNFLQAYEIAQMDLSQTQMVVLSACETGYGRLQNGEGVMSLARSFMYAGVPSLVVSLWQVNDASTAIIMKKFYKNLAKGEDKAEALRNAKLGYIQDTEKSNDLAAHPAFWAAFVMLGDEEAVEITSTAQVGNWFWWVLAGAGILLLLVLGRFILRKKAETA